MNESLNRNNDRKKSGERQLVVFKIGDEEFGVDINEVREINRWEEVTRIPNSAPYVKGVINLRGNIIVVTDLAMKLGMPSKEIDDDTRVLVIELGNNETVGMVVDSATEVMRLSDEQIKDTPSLITSNIDVNYIEGVGLLDNKRLLTLLDLSKVLGSKDYKNISQVQQNFESNKADKKIDIESDKPVKEEEEKKEESKKEEKKVEEKKVDDQDSSKDTEKTDDKKEINKQAKKENQDKNTKTSEKTDENDKEEKTEETNKKENKSSTNAKK